MVSSRFDSALLAGHVFDKDLSGDPTVKDPRPRPATKSVIPPFRKRPRVSPNSDNENDGRAMPKSSFSESRIIGNYMPFLGPNNENDFTTHEPIASPRPFPKKSLNELYSDDPLLQKIQAIVDKATHANAILLLERKTHNAEIAGLKAEREALESEKNSLAVENSELKERVKSLEQEVKNSELKERVKSLEQEVKNGIKALEAYKKRVRALGNEF